MSQHDDVSWPLVESIARRWIGPDAKLEEICLLAGGIINTTVGIRVSAPREIEPTSTKPPASDSMSSSCRAVLKISPHRANHAHAREARELELLESLGVPVPRVLLSQTASLESPHSFLLIDHVEGMSFRAARPMMSPAAIDAVERQLAEIVVRIHSHTADAYGRFEGARFTDWPAFYHSLVDPVLAEADKLAVIPKKSHKVIERVHARLDQLLDTGDVPRLLHGDLWSANLMVAPTGVDDGWRIAAVIDPELRFGHAEAELAYMELYKTATPAFRTQYQKTFKLSERYHTVRRPVYQMYGLLNQLQLHGPSATTPLIEAVDKVAPLV
jgi:fructosamine-3-kinase